MWFEQSGHEPFVDEPDKFNATMADVVRLVLLPESVARNRDGRRARHGPSRGKMRRCGDNRPGGATTVIAAVRSVTLAVSIQSHLPRADGGPSSHWRGHRHAARRAGTCGHLYLMPQLLGQRAFRADMQHRLGLTRAVVAAEMGVPDGMQCRVFR